MKLDKHLNRLEEAKRKDKIRLIVSTIVAVSLIIWSWWGTGFSIPAMMRGVPNIYQFITEDLLPPQFGAYRRFIGPTFETLFMAYAGGVIAVIISLVLGIMSAGNIVKTRSIVYLGRAISTFLRAVPAVVWAVIMVAAVGIGPFAGTISLALGGAGMLGKTYADSLEDIDMGQVEALQAVGASWWQIFTQAVWPQFLPAFLSWSFYRFDLNIRSAAIVGLVGGGGLGFILNTTIKLFQFKQAAVGILWIFGLILIIEYLTAKSRDKILEGL